MLPDEDVDRVDDRPADSDEDGCGERGGVVDFALEAVHDAISAMISSARVTPEFSFCKHVGQ